MFTVKIQSSCLRIHSYFALHTFIQRSYYCYDMGTLFCYLLYLKPLSHIVTGYSSVPPTPWVTFLVHLLFSTPGTALCFLVALLTMAPVKILPTPHYTSVPTLCTSIVPVILLCPTIIRLIYPHSSLPCSSDSCQCIT